MASNDLVPEKRFNKHGVPVTKHVKPMTSSVPAGQPLPAPVITANEGLDMMLDKIVAELPPWGSGDERIRSSFEAIEEDNLQLALDVARAYLAGDKECRAVWRNLLIRIDPLSPANEPMIRRAIEVVPLSVEITPNAPPGFRYAKAMDYLEYAANNDDSGDYSQAKPEMILFMLDRMSGGAPDRLERVEYIAENYDAVLRLYTQLMERKDSSIEFMKLLVENKSHSLADGVL
jgi:hypothetical protein